jgi:peptide/nickel transport system substrate-binding protein
MGYLKEYKILLLIFTFVSCNTISDNNEIIQEVNFFASGLDPAKDYKSFEYQIFSQIYEPLLTLKNDYKTLLPCLARSWSLGEDNVTYTFHLQPNVKFHDGTLLTAETAKFSFMRQIELRSDHPIYHIIETIKVVAPLTLQIKLKYPYISFLYFLASPTGLIVISKKAIEKYGENLDKNPVGTGPFFLKKWIDNKKIVLEAFPEYREKSTIQRVQFIPHDSTSLSINLFKRGRLDIMYMVDAQWLDRLKWSGNVEYLIQKPNNTIYFGFNLANYPVNIDKVRKAILMAVNINKSVLISNRGNAIPAKNPIPPIYGGFDDLKQYDNNPNLAIRYLKEMGFENNLTLNLYVWSPAYSRQMKIELLKSQLEKVGISLNTRFFNREEEFTDNIDDKNCHLFLSGYGSDLIGDPGDFLYSLFHSASPNNHFNYHNGKIDLLLELAFQEINEEKRHEIYRSIVKIVLTDTPAVFDSHVKSHFAYNSNKIKSMVVNPYDFIYFHRLETYD